MMARNLKYAIESSNLETLIPIEKIEITDDIVISEGITRVPVLELWVKNRMKHYHVGMLSQAQITDILLEKVHKE